VYFLSWEKLSPRQGKESGVLFSLGSRKGGDYQKEEGPAGGLNLRQGGGVLFEKIPYL